GQAQELPGRLPRGARLPGEDIEDVEPAQGRKELRRLSHPAAEVAGALEGALHTGLGEARGRAGGYPERDAQADLPLVALGALGQRIEELQRAAQMADRLLVAGAAQRFLARLLPPADGLG